MRAVVLALGFLLLSDARATAQAAQAGRRIAVVVGANAAAPGRRPLRFAQNDARAVASVLREVSGFRPEDVHLLLDPAPAEVLTVLDRSRTTLAGLEEGTLFFYYSGHADERALYPAGQPVTFAALRERLDDANVRIRIGVVDTCRGGSWTGTRGLAEGEVFEVETPLNADSEGAVLIASSSGLEDAHESPDFEGGFFTHHWNAGLRGAADGNDDGTVTLTEAFEYAKRLTIRDTALRGRDPQHPSFKMNLRGRHDLSLAQIAETTQPITLAQETGPLQVIHLESGLIVLEVPPGERRLRVALPAGRYVLRVSAAGGTRAREFSIGADQPTVLREADLALIATGALAVRGVEPETASVGAVRDGDMQLSFALGVNHEDREDRSDAAGVAIGSSDSTLALTGSWVYAITDRLLWGPLSAAFAYRFGDHGRLEWIPAGGLTRWSVGRSSLEGTMLAGVLGAALDARLWLTPRSSLLLGGRVGSNMRWTSRSTPTGEAGWSGLVDWAGRVRAGYIYAASENVSLSLSIDFWKMLLLEGSVARGAEAYSSTVGIGSSMIGLQSLPLVRVELADWFALDGYARVDYHFESREVRESYMAGFTATW